MAQASTSIFHESFDKHLATAERSRELLERRCADLISAAVKSIREKGKIVFLGNGGSAADAQHLSAELTIRYRKDRAPIAAIALTTDTSAMTAAINDMGPDQIFARQVQALCHPQDLVIAISTSGNSSNVISALDVARSIGCATAVLTGRDGGVCAQIADIAIIVPSDVTARIQEIHILIGHIFCEALESELDLV